ncbi:MAG: phosphatidylserine/phosphatidylglycerophosphate/cardiolipin synthase family protein [Deltaproteobacteria bacterium]|nr:phosphatidylserine/phosphatidylglycerophosphate/cardiolipin synthase family protein [Deltaproteobacteria bacterium]
MTYPESHIPHAKNGSYPLRFGNTVRPLIDGGPAFRRICEAVEQARHSVWLTVAFLDEDFQMPDGYGSLFDVLDRAKKRGLDVRAIFWRSLEWKENDHFEGNAEHRQFLSSRGSTFHARWDRLPKTWCHHQKSWLIDAGKDTEIVFVGGINLGIYDIVEPGHEKLEDGSIHDIYVEVRGPAATDVHHNFVQRWNEASERNLPDGSWPAKELQSDLLFPESLTDPAGNIPVQITRTVRRETYTDTTASVGGDPFPITKGEQSTLEQYCLAIDAAKETIYIEDQAIGALQIIEKMEQALARGVEVVYVLPGNANFLMVAALKDPRSRPFLDKLQGLGRYSNFTMAALAANRGPGKYTEVYVHAKIAIVDGVWATIGSCNIADRSFYSDTELNASFWDKDAARGFMNDLLKEHLVMDVSHMTDREALKFFKETARENTMRRVRGEPLQGLAFQMDPAHYPAVDPWLPSIDSV